ncbi:MAG: CDP-glycerol glycerophosphotransferase family protein [Acidobacteria bacterium]|nr:CDP-glycerol glycerophosphotransferase family protein [Acidobacteriota bacterium]
MELRRFQAGNADPRIVFYAEDHSSWPHFEPIVNDLTGRLGRQIAYVTSSARDPILKMGDPHVDAYGIGAGATRIMFFETLRNSLVIMTMPDLNMFHIKRTRLPGVHYVYVQHSLVSTHMAYRKGAFDHFDTIFCAGPHHVVETRATENIYGLRVKNLIEHGYGRLDAILRDSPAITQVDRAIPHILLAPSWGEHAILETVGEPVVNALLEAGYRVTVRPHPRTRQRCSKALDDLARRFYGNDNFTLEEKIASQRSLLNADLMISDWSGAALEYALGLGKPVLFINVPRKVNNPEYGNLPMEPIEVSVRKDLGAIVAPGDWAALCSESERLINATSRYSERLRRLRLKTVFNVDRSGEIGASALVDLFDNQFG